MWWRYHRKFCWLRMRLQHSFSDGKSTSYALPVHIRLWVHWFYNFYIHQSADHHGESESLPSRYICIKHAFVQTRISHHSVRRSDLNLNFNWWFFAAFGSFLAKRWTLKRFYKFHTSTWVLLSSDQDGNCIVTIRVQMVSIYSVSLSFSSQATISIVPNHNE